MQASEDGYCPSCHEGDITTTGFLDRTQFLLCNQCGKRYKFNVPAILDMPLPFVVIINSY